MEIYKMNMTNNPIINPIMYIYNTLSVIFVINWVLLNKEGEGAISFFSERIICSN